MTKSQCQRQQAAWGNQTCYLMCQILIIWRQIMSSFAIRKQSLWQALSGPTVLSAGGIPELGRPLHMQHDEKPSKDSMPCWWNNQTEIS